MDKDLKIPKHVGIILDGNGRWAEERGLSRSEGHRAGFSTLKNLAAHVLSSGVDVLSVYAFSTENFKRSKEEVDFLMNLFITGFKNDKKFYQKKNIKVVFSSKGKPLRDDVLNAMHEVESLTKDNTGGIFNICLNYGGRSEIVEATKRIHHDLNNNIIKEEDVTEELLKKYMYQDLPDIDFLIRTSGETRISNFMLYQLSYAEFYFPKIYFPEFNESEFDDAILVYNKRDRRFGGYNK